ncbi:butirosin biosynthesis protein H-like [Chitinophaga skermanii]|uniref:Butirosin biosynthesis protein H-like n=2 Tax=Chitinophaga skermanii TaxID=331697 RepID=A0A327R317_9BACT|nr:butirosin biosynthesis protein H-like [Chitinophaga skermanii]
MQTAAPGAINNKMNQQFNHVQSAHCESGVVSNLLRHNGLQISEPMAFGIGSGIFFGHLPFVKVNGIPGTTYRIWPSGILNKVCKRLGVQVHSEKFSNPQKAMAALDQAVAANIPVGMQSSVYYLPYLPQAYRFHFNAHNLVVFGKEGNEYLVSDPVMEGPAKIDPESLAQARFAKGYPEPKGRMYHVSHVPSQVDFRKPVKQGIEQTCNFMLKVPFPMLGIKGIRYLSKKIVKYPELGERKAALFLGNIIRMQEEIGTGGAGFRFMYAAFLQEAGIKLQNDELRNLAQSLTAVGDEWRNFAFEAGRVCKARTVDQNAFVNLSQLLMHVAEGEQQFFTKLSKVKL